MSSPQKNFVQRVILIVFLCLAFTEAVNAGKIVCKQNPLSCSLTYSTFNENDTPITVNIPILTAAKAENILYTFQESDGEDNQKFEIDEFSISELLNNFSSDTIEAEFDCLPSDVENQRLARQESLEKGSTGNALKNNWRVFVTTCGTIKTKSLQEIKACNSPIYFATYNNQLEGLEKEATVTSAFVNSCGGVEGMYVQASTVTTMPFHIVRCNYNQDQPFLMINNDLFENDPELMFKEVVNNNPSVAASIQKTGKYYAGLSCISANVPIYKMINNKHQKVIESYPHQVTVSVTIPNASDLLYGIASMVENNYDFAAYNKLAELKITKKRVLSLLA